MHCLFRRSMPGFPALDSIVHTWYKNKTNLSYPQNPHCILRRLSVKEPKQIKQIKWYYIDTPHPAPLLPKPITTPKWTKAMGELIPNYCLDFDCGPQR